MSDLKTLRGLHALATTLVARINDALEEHEAEAARIAALPAVTRGRTNPAIVAVLSTLGPMKAGDVAEHLRKAGRDVTDDAVYQACHRMAAAGALRRQGGRYAVTEAESGS